MGRREATAFKWLKLADVESIGICALALWRRKRRRCLGPFRHHVSSSVVVVVVALFAIQVVVVDNGCRRHRVMLGVTWVVGGC